MSVASRISRQDTYYNVLCAAISELEHDSFESRGAVYDRWWTGIHKQLQANPAYSADDIARERSAFLGAIQQIEFGQGSDQQPAGVPPLERAAGVESDRPQSSRWALVRSVGLRAALACLVIVFAGVVASLVATHSGSATASKRSNADSIRSYVSRLLLDVGELVEGRFGRRQANVQRAVLHEERGGNATEGRHIGRAIWRAGSDNAAATALDPGSVLSIDVAIPQRDFALKISLQRVTEGGGAISHFVEFQFARSNQTPTDTVVDVLGILMKNDEASRGIELVGKVVSVRPGLFLMGLSGADADVRRNLELLRDRPWLDIPIVLKGGSRSILAIEKGPAGQDAVAQTLSTWGYGGAN